MIKAIEYWSDACTHLSKHDPIMAQLINEFSPQPMKRHRRSAFIVLCRAIVGQQISVKAAETIWQRLMDAYPEFKPEVIQRCRKERLQRCGLSESKARYLKNIARFFIAERVEQEYWKQDYLLIQESLLSIAGVGPWTFEMFAIFYLHHPDVFPVGDMGLVNAISRLYYKGEKLDRDTVHRIGESWAPWRTVATWYLWRSIDESVVVY